MPPRQAIGLGCMFALGAAIAFPAGLLLGGGGEDSQGGRARRAGGEFRNPYSPSLLEDPAFIDQQRRNAQALEESCRRTGAYCEEARQVRRWLAERGE